MVHTRGHGMGGSRGTRGTRLRGFPGQDIGVATREGGDGLMGAAPVGLHGF